MNKIILYLVILLHKLIVYFTIFGWLMPIKYVKMHLLCFPLILIHWQLNDNKCILTQLEHHLKNVANESPTVDKDHEISDFNIRLLKQFGFNTNLKNIHKYIIIFISICWLISLYKIKIK